MKIVIDIPEEFYQNSCETGFLCWEWMSMLELTNAIKNGTPLPKGHGRLIDADETLKAIDTWDKFGYTETGCFVREPKNDYVPYVYYEDMITSISNAPTIIEADKETDNG